MWFDILGWVWVVTGSERIKQAWFKAANREIDRRRQKNV